MTRAALLALAALAAACRSPQTELDLVPAGDAAPCGPGAATGPDLGASDAGPPDAESPDAGKQLSLLDAGAPDSGARDSGSSDAGASDAGVDDLGCANFLEFTVNDGTSFSTHCIKLRQPLQSLCDLNSAADGEELFKLSPGSQVQISVRGLRVFPATSCDLNAACVRAPDAGGGVIFEGSTDWIRIGDVEGRAVQLPVKVDEPCGAPEQFFFKPDGGTCASVCDVAKVVCEVQGGCLCKGL